MSLFSVDRSQHPAKHSEEPATLVVLVSIHPCANLWPAEVGLTTFIEKLRQQWRHRDDSVTSDAYGMSIERVTQDSELGGLWNDYWVLIKYFALCFILCQFMCLLLWSELVYWAIIVSDYEEWVIVHIEWVLSESDSELAWLLLAQHV